MPKTSVIIPSRNEQYLTKTVHDLFAKKTGELEVIAVIDGGDWPAEWDKTADRYPGKLITIHHGQSWGMRASINQAAAIASGDYLMKTDAHCMFAKGFDVALRESCGSKTIVVPRRYRLDPEKWEIIKDGRLPVDYEYLTPPDSNGGGLKGKVWEQRAKDRKDILQDELWLFQGSCWYAPRSYFYDLDLMDESNYGTFWKEALELSCKAWLSGGRVIVNKETWYSHFHKKTRGYSMLSEDQTKAQEYCKKWVSDETGWPKQIHPFTFLLEKFNPPEWNSCAIPQANIST